MQHLKKNKQKLNWIRLAEHGRIPIDCKYINPRIKYDGINGWITVGMEYEKPAVPSSNEGIGIDLGIKDLAACSDEHKHLSINKTQKVKKLVCRFLIPHIPSTRYLYTRIKKTVY